MTRFTFGFWYGAATLLLGIAVFVAVLIQPGVQGLAALASGIVSGTGINLMLWGYDRD